MPENIKQEPTAGELEILNVLWRLGSCTVRTVNDEINKTKEAGYTTTLKLMQIMFEKGLLKRNDDQRSHIYSAAVAKEETQQAIVGNVIDTAFGGSSAQLVMQALGGKKASKEEIDEIRKFLDDMEMKAKE